MWEAWYPCEPTVEPNNLWWLIPKSGSHRRPWLNTVGHQTKPNLVNKGNSYGGGVVGRGGKEEGESERKRDQNMQSTCIKFYERTKFINKNKCIRVNWVSIVRQMFTHGMKNHKPVACSPHMLALAGVNVFLSCVVCCTYGYCIWDTVEGLIKRWWSILMQKQCKNALIKLLNLNLKDNTPKREVLLPTLWVLSTWSQS